MFKTELRPVDAYCAGAVGPWAILDGNGRTIAWCKSQVDAANILYRLNGYDAEVEA